MQGVYCRYFLIEGTIHSILARSCERRWIDRKWLVCIMPSFVPQTQLRAMETNANYFQIDKTVYSTTVG